MGTVNEIDIHTLLRWRAEGKKVRLIDVRSIGETIRGVIDGAEVMPLHLLPLKVHELAEKTAHNDIMVLYCQTGSRSYQACAFLAKRGLPNAYNLRRGILGWMLSGHLLVEPQRIPML
jgi:rhodanese-related sulfurtransferase